MTTNELESIRIELVKRAYSVRHRFEAGNPTDGPLVSSITRLKQAQPYADEISTMLNAIFEERGLSGQERQEAIDYTLPTVTELLAELP